MSPFWATWTFRTSVIGLVVGTLVVAYRRRVRSIQTRRRALEDQVRERSEAAEALQGALSEVEQLKNRLEAENTYLQEEIKLTHNFEEILTQSETFKRVLGSVEQVASTDATVLILGESGTGKELLARAIHSISPRCERPLVKVNCAALPANLIESELFGHVKGAYTGAVATKPGRFALADGGTIFLDEIGDLPLELQSKLLRVLQEGEFEALGDTKTTRVNVRVIAATNRDLDEAVAMGDFRKDLFYRLNVFPIVLPALRERKEDIPLLVRHFVDRYTGKMGKQIDEIPQALIDALGRYHWPGNVRELENIIERAVIVSPKRRLILGDWFPDTVNPVQTPQDGLATLEETERNHIVQALEKTSWRVSGDRGAARILGINPKTLDSRMRKLGIDRKARQNSDI
jgi:transcriptional regulator with GAF, ATPase, and Fis domain